tara:strand:+ start:2139 stop:3380 length:1242 start_codon:yes stop_codon:yes gene_type:complete
LEFKRSQSIFPDVKLNRNLIFIIFLSISSSLFSQNVSKYEDDIKFHSSELDRLRSEMKEFESRINSTANKEKSAQQLLEDLNEEITLVRNLIYRLRKEEKDKQHSIDEAQEMVRDKKMELENLKSRYARRVAQTYKKGKLSDFDLLVDSDSWRQAIYRAKYLKVISDYDKALARDISVKIVEIENIKQKLEIELRDIKAIDREKSASKSRLEKQQKSRDRELAKLKKEKRTLTKGLADRRESAKKLEAIINRLEKEKTARLAELERIRREEKELLAGGDFSKLKGKLSWPIQGKIISRFGRQYNSSLKTYMENTGIDIQTKAGTEVRSVFDGIVTTITYIRGYGNTIIVDHGNDFYTVYTHVGDVEVEENSYIKAKEVIAYIGSGSELMETKLHFEIWGNRKKLDPEKWLRKS